MERTIDYTIIFIASVIIPSLPFLLLLIKNFHIEPIFLFLSSIPIILSFILLSYLLRDSITRDPNKMGIFHYIGRLSKYLLPIFGIFYYLSIIASISSEYYLLLYFIEGINKNLIFIPYIIVLLFPILNIMNIDIESKFEKIIAYSSIILILIFILFSIFPINIKTNNYDIFTFSIIYFSSFFSGVDLLTYYSNNFNNKRTGNATFYGTIISSIFSVLFYLSFLNITSSNIYPIILFISLPFGILATYIWFYTSNNILKYISEEKLLPYIFRIKNKKDVPIFNILLSTIIIFIFLFLSKINNILAYFSVFTILIYILYIISYIKIKLSSKYFNKKRFYKIFIATFSLILFLYYLLYEINQNISALIISIIIFIIILSITIKISWKKDIKFIKLYFSNFYIISYIIRKIFYKEDLKLIEDFIKEGYNILDFGPFSGDLSIKLAKKYNVKVYGIDISIKIIRKLLKKIKGLKNYYVYIAKKDEIPKFLHNYIDLIIVYETLKFIIDHNKFVKNIYKTLKNNGYFISINYVDFLEKKDFEEEIEKIRELLESYKIKTIIIKINKHIYTKYILIGKKL